MLRAKGYWIGGGLSGASQQIVQTLFTAVPEYLSYFFFPRRFLILELFCHWAEASRIFFCLFVCFRFYKTKWRFSNRKGKLAGTETNNIEILFWQVLISKLLHAARLLEFTAGQQAGALEILSACSPRFSFMHCSICKMKYGLLKIFSLLYNLLFKEESLSNSHFWHCLIFNSAG